MGSKLQKLYPKQNKFIVDFAKAARIRTKVNRNRNATLFLENNNNSANKVQLYTFFLPSLGAVFHFIYAVL